MLISQRFKREGYLHCVNGVCAVAGAGGKSVEEVRSGEKVIYSQKQCPTMTEEERKIKQAEVDEVVKILDMKATVCPGGIGAAAAGGDAAGGGGNGVEKIGYGISVIVATFGYFFSF
uniref:Uncharacterized protein n=1 Tax=Panagrolaimus superbus TaxID=310955 RepID=A0A914Y6V4_9BILA